MKFPEAGYTPANLRHLLNRTGATREEAAEILAVSLRAVHRWCVGLDNPNHRDMALEKWEFLVAELDPT